MIFNTADPSHPTLPYIVKVPEGGGGKGEGKGKGGYIWAELLLISNCVSVIDFGFPTWCIVNWVIMISRALCAMYVITCRGSIPY